jgi:hypothetical protein
MKHLVKELNSKEMNRRQFLLHLGVGILGIIGISGFFKNLITLGNSSNHTIKAKDTDYGK